MIGAGNRFAFKNFASQNALSQFALGILNGRRRSRLTEVDASAGGIDKADRLVGQLASANVATGEFNGIDDGFFEDVDFMMLLERLG